jgi:hypothetical protein
MKDFVTEADAKKKACPMIVGHDDEIATPRDCVASSCMAWRWSHQDPGPNSPATGFCGAFGLPKYF